MKQSWDTEINKGDFFETGTASAGIIPIHTTTESDGIVRFPYARLPQDSQAPVTGG